LGKSWLHGARLDGSDQKLHRLGISQ
jgi:hypothetical protein